MVFVCSVAVRMQCDERTSTGTCPPQLLPKCAREIEADDAALREPTTDRAFIRYCMTLTKGEGRNDGGMTMKVEQPVIGVSVSKRFYEFRDRRWRMQAALHCCAAGCFCERS